MIRWDVRLYRRRIDTRDMMMFEYIIVIEADSYKAAWKKTREQFPAYHSSSIRIERIPNAV